MICPLKIDRLPWLTTFLLSQPLLVKASLSTRGPAPFGVTHPCWHVIKSVKSLFASPVSLSMPLENIEKVRGSPTV